MKKILKLTGGIPVAKTYERVISTINSEELNSMFLNFVKEVQYAESINFKDILSFDVKVESGSGRNKGIKREEVCPLNVLNVYSDRLQMCIDQEIIETKTNEITAIPKVIKRLNLKRGML